MDWLKAADVENGVKPGLTREQAAKNREFRRRLRQLEQETEVVRRAIAYTSQAKQPATLYPLVRELSRDGVPVAVTCRVLRTARQPYYRWLVRQLGAEL